MSNASDNLLEFQCPKCARRLKAAPQAAGKRLKCPGCGQPVKVPGPVASTASDDDWLQLDTPAETPAPAAAPARASNPTPGDKPKPRSTGAEPSQPSTKSAANLSAKPPVNASSKPSEAGATAPKPASIFDDDLPELAELEAPRPRVEMVNILGIEGLDELVPAKPPKPAPAKSGAPAPTAKEPPSKKAAALDPANQQYRVACPTCGTPQYVTVAKQGKMIKCPDCFADFKIPPPPPGWNATKPAHTNWGTGLRSESEAETQKDNARSKAAADEYLRKAEKELNDEELDDLYQGEFDTKGFVERTFGFLFDPPALFQIFVYSILFALLFAIAAWCSVKIAEGDKGFALVSGLAVPLLALMAAFPMFAGAMTLLESVANGEKKVSEWPGFNFFEHVGELLLFGSAVGLSSAPGILIGGFIGQSGGMWWMVTLATMLTSFLAFPICLLGMMDNGSLFNPFSIDVLKSISVGFESWATYYFKTFCAYFLVFVAWSVLLSGNPVMAGMGGALLPLLIFFTTQQLGILAFDISEHLSLVPSKDDEEESEES